MPDEEIDEEIIDPNSVITVCQHCGLPYTVATLVKTNVWTDNGIEHFSMETRNPRINPDFPKVCLKSPDRRHKITLNY